MRNILAMKSWSPYVVGAGIGVLSWFAFVSADHPLGISTAFETTAALGLQEAAPWQADDSTFFAEHDPKIGWEWMLVLGVFFGSLASSLASGDRETFTVPPMWQARFGPSRTKRLAVAFLGGMIMIFGARLAGGCTSGHGISGNLQFAVSSLVFSVLFFSFGVATVFLLYGKSALPFPDAPPGVEAVSSYRLKPGLQRDTTRVWRSKNPRTRTTRESLVDKGGPCGENGKDESNCNSTVHY